MLTITIGIAAILGLASFGAACHVLGYRRGIRTTLDRQGYHQRNAALDDKLNALNARSIEGIGGTGPRALYQAEATIRKLYARSPPKPPGGTHP